MLQAHSFLWHYLWVGTNVIFAALGILLWRRGVQSQFPVFVAYALLTSSEQLILYAADVAPWITEENFWLILCGGLLIEGFLKMLLIGELFGHLLGDYSSVAELGKQLIGGLGGVLVFGALAGAVFSPRDNNHWFISGAHLMEQTIYVVECGLLLFLFVFAAYFRLAWGHLAFGIALAMSISGCVHLAVWAAASGGAMLDKRYLLDFINMAAYHVCVLTWGYYVLVPQKSVIPPSPQLPDHNLERWNRELESLLRK
jgi:hypothetical protein